MKQQVDASMTGLMDEGHQQDRAVEGAAEGGVLVRVVAVPIDFPLICHKLGSPHEFDANVVLLRIDTVEQPITEPEQVHHLAGRNILSSKHRRQ